MSDFYTVLRQSIIDRGLSSPESREEAYAQARRAMVNRLWSYEPPLAEDEIDHRIGQFDIAVARIEDDVAAVFATMEAERDHAGEAIIAEPDDDAALAGPSDDDGDDDDPGDDGGDEDYPATFGGAPGDIAGDEDEPRPAGMPARSSTRRAVPSPARSRATTTRTTTTGTRTPGKTPASAPTTRTSGAGRRTSRAMRHTTTGTTRTRPTRKEPPARPARLRLRRGRCPRKTPSAGAGRAPPREAGPALALRLRQKAAAAMPTSEAGQLRLLIGVVAGLAIVLAIGLAWVLLPGGTTTRVGAPAMLQTNVPGGVSDHDTAIRLPREAISVTSSFTLFNGQDPTVFAGDPGNPVRFDGEYARIATSAGSPGAKVIIGAGLSSRFAGRIIRVTIDARSARENGATSMRFAYESGVAISHWQTANLAADFTELGLVWRVPSMRTSPTGDYIVIEPGIPGSGSAVEIRSVRIDLVDQ